MQTAANNSNLNDGPAPIDKQTGGLTNLFDFRQLITDHSGLERIQQKNKSRNQ